MNRQSMVWMTVALLGLIAALPSGSRARWQEEGESPRAMLERADALRKEGSFRAARQLYETLLQRQPPLPDELRHPAQFGALDTLWRERGEMEAFQQAERDLGRMIEDLPEGSRWRAEAAESLGDLRAATRGWGDLKPVLQPWLQAIQYWGDAPDVDAARPRYIALNLKLADLIVQRQGIVPIPADADIQRIGILPPPPPPDRPHEGDLASWALRNVLRVSADPVEQARARYLLGMLRTRAESNVPEGWEKEGEQYLKEVAEARPVNEWTDDAMWELAMYYQRKQRFVEAVAVLRSYLETFQRGQAPQWDQARATLDQIVRPSASLGGAVAYAPGSYVRLAVLYRNQHAASLTLTAVDPETLLNFWRTELARPSMGRWMRGRTPLDGERLTSITLEGIVDDGTHAIRTKEVYLEPRPAGIYRAHLIADGDANDDARDHLFLVSQLGVLVKHEGRDVHGLVVDAETGRPVAGARVWVVYAYTLRGSGTISDVRTAQGETDPQGLAVVSLAPPASNEEPDGRFRVLALHDGQAAWAEGYMGRAPRLEEDRGTPVVYAFSDRPAYRPGEPIRWKAIVRFTDGKEYQLPQAESAFVRIRDARSQVVWEGTRPFNNFGTLEGEFTTTQQTALGMMIMEIWNRADDRLWTGLALCRLEEYKLPEFKVQVVPAEGQRRLGDAVPFDIAAEYYFGGPVAGAEVEVVVHRRAFRMGWRPPRPYPWFYEGEFAMPRRRGPVAEGRFPGLIAPYEPEQVVLTQTLRTDARGRARVEIGALSEDDVRQARDRGLWGYEYRVEARVVDASRREVRASGSARVARTAFAAHLWPQRYLYLPGDTIRLELKTLDPNDRATAAEGMVTIYRRVWNPNKKDEQGHTRPGYDDTRLFARPAATSADEGRAIVAFDLGETGCYLARFESRDAFGAEVTAETVFFVARTDTTALGYRSGGVEIITDRDTYARGETAHVLLVVRRPGAAVWFAVEGERVLRSMVVVPEETVKLVSIPITEEFEPNVFFTAYSAFDYSTFSDRTRIVVPPQQRFLDVKIVAEKREFRPGERATLQVEVADASGAPVATELALAVADAAVWAIQGDLAGDVRRTFWSRMRYLQVQTISHNQHYNFEQWLPDPDKPGQYKRRLREEIEGQDAAGRVVDELSTAPASGATLYFSRGGGRGGRAGGLAADAAPAPALALRMQAATSELALADAKLAEEGAAEPRVRTDFSATALWLASVVTDAQGRATAEVVFPDSLTTWRLTAVACDRATRVGQVREEVRTNKPIMVRPQGPRFFIEGDEATLSAIVNNNTSATQTVEVALDARGLKLAQGVAAEGRPSEPSTEPVLAATERVRIAVPAQQQRRVDWRVAVPAPGEAIIRTQALAAVDSDAVEKKFKIYEYGIEQFIAQGAVMREAGDLARRELTLEIPAQRRAGSESLTIWLEPSLARTMVNALDYLAQYPYGCVEQTLSRFVPAVITARVLQQLGLRRPELEAKLPDMIRAGLDRLYDFQHADGGWAWWRDGASDPFMTAYVLQGLGHAQEADVTVRPDVIERAASYLQQELIRYERADDLTAFMLYALATVGNVGNYRAMADAAHERLWPRREQLNPYTRALYALACHLTGRHDRAQVLARNLRNGLIEDREGGTAHWGEAGVHYRWSDGGVEATAFSLRALLAIEPQSDLIEPAMTWLVRNRRGAQWKNTRDTAIVVRALADYITVRKEAAPSWTAEVRVNGELIRTLTVTPETFFDFDGKIEVPAERLRTGANTVEIVRRGGGILYASAWLRYFTRQEAIRPAGNEVFVERAYFRTRQVPTLSGAYRTEREPIGDGAELASGDRIEVQLTLEAKNHYEYLVLEDLKAAGMEPTDVQSGHQWAQGLTVHRELRDERTAFFIDRLPEGKHTLTYELRAEVPGVFHALPASIHAMYVPEIRANSAGARARIVDR